MNEHQRELARKLRQPSSAEAADWLLEHCPLGGDALGNAWALLPRLSWKPADQYRVGRHYLTVHGPSQRVGDMTSAGGYYELNPLTGRWENITLYPEIINRDAE